MNQIKLFITLILFLLVDISCTKLNTKVYDKVPLTNFWRTPDEIAAGVAPAYAGLRNMLDMFGNYPLQECSTDEVIIGQMVESGSNYGNIPGGQIIIRYNLTGNFFMEEFQE